jgi:hypothetical protein
VIRISRGAEPASLAAARPIALARCGPTGPASREDLPTDYQRVSRELWRAQHFKCCYCESREQNKRNDVEHFRPAMRTDRRPGSAATHGYWWLAFTWENLLFACRNCNQSPFKLDKFPLAVGSTALVATQSPPGLERPLLLDPSSESGVEDIEFVRALRPDGAIGWTPRARNGSARGHRTIQVLGLDRPDLLELYELHVAEVLRPDLDQLLSTLRGGDPAGIAAGWSLFIRRHLQLSAVYVGLTLGVLDAEVPATTRAAWNLRLPTL